MRCLSPGMCQNAAASAVVGVRRKSRLLGLWRLPMARATTLGVTMSPEIRDEAFTPVGIVHASTRHSLDAGLPGGRVSLLDAWSWTTSLPTRSQTTWAFGRNC